MSGSGLDDGRRGERRGRVKRVHTCGQWHASRRRGGSACATAMGQASRGARTRAWTGAEKWPVAGTLGASRVRETAAEEREEGEIGKDRREKKKRGRKWRKEKEKEREIRGGDCGRTRTRAGRA